MVVTHGSKIRSGAELTNFGDFFLKKIRKKTEADIIDLFVLTNQQFESVIYFEKKV